MFANAQLSGQDIAGPELDICKTPPAAVPAPFPNFAMRIMAVGFVPKILFMSAPAHNLGTTIPMSMGDEPGVMGGIKSLILKGASRNTSGVSKVILTGMPATKLTNPTLQNLINCSGKTLVPCQTKVVMLS